MNSNIDYNPTFLTEPRLKDVLVFDLGNPMEAHGPALYYDNDTTIAQKVAFEAIKSGGRYAGSIPYATDKVGKIALAWCPAFIQKEEFLDKTTDFVRLAIEPYQRLENTEKMVVIINAHGGNPMNLGEILEERLGIKVVTVEPTMYGIHAYTIEHSVAAYLGLHNPEGLKLLNEVAKNNPVEAMKRWPCIVGLAGFWKYKGGEFEVLYNGPHKEEFVQEFIRNREIFIDLEKGREVFELHVATAKEAIRTVFRITR
jgi:creatinine amidohydrolase/Fe(II)-dependent formamide hydrolase-like protein